MRVNSCFILLLAILFIASSFKEYSGPDLQAKRVNLMIRQIGHRLLLQAGDSTSRVLPVTEITEGTFLLRFENEFAFNHDSLIVLSQRLLPKTQFLSGYIVTVQDCAKSDIVFGFQLNNAMPDILACSGRSQPPGCYTIEFAFPDFYANLKQQKAILTGPLNEPVKTDPVELSPKPEAQKRTILPSASLVTAQSDRSWSWPLISLILTGLLLLMGVTFLIWRFGRILKPAAMQNQNHALTRETAPEPATLGKFLFNSQGQRLLLGAEVIRLTDKECKVLDLLYKNFGKLIPRETLMQEIWISEGVITSRSLDMFVSKLRKKLSRDPELSITNVHGKGYMLEIP